MFFNGKCIFMTANYNNSNDLQFKDGCGLQCIVQHQQSFNQPPLQQAE